MNIFNISDEAKQKWISFGKTFLVVFISTMIVILKSDDLTISWTLAFWNPILMAALRAGLTEALAPYLPIKLGGKKVDSSVE